MLETLVGVGVVISFSILCSVVVGIWWWSGFVHSHRVHVKTGDERWDRMEKKNDEWRAEHKKQHKTEHEILMHEVTLRNGSLKERKDK